MLRCIYDVIKPNRLFPLCPQSPHALQTPYYGRRICAAKCWLHIRLLCPRWSMRRHINPNTGLLERGSVCFLQPCTQSRLSPTQAKPHPCMETDVVCSSCNAPNVSASQAASTTFRTYPPTVDKSVRGGGSAVENLSQALKKWSCRFIRRCFSKEYIFAT